MDKIKKIIVTGSAGFIGSSLCAKLLKRGDHIVGNGFSVILNDE